MHIKTTVVLLTAQHVVHSAPRKDILYAFNTTTHASSSTINHLQCFYNSKTFSESSYKILTYVLKCRYNMLNHMLK
jgi:hypothetical protein